MQYDGRLTALLLAFILLCSPGMAIDLQPDMAQKHREESRDGLNIFRHNWNYFLSGQPDSKVQFSFKIQFLHNWDLYFGYTQQMYWDLGKDSSPFSDINYNPEIFYRWYLNNGILKGIDLGPFEHRSNGRDGEASRSWDRTYVAARTEFQIGTLKSKWDTKVFHLYNLDKTNPDMDAKLGNVETTFSLGGIFSRWLPEDELQLRVAPGGKLNLQQMEGYQEVDFRFRLPIRRFNPFLYMQVYNGVSESLLQYTTNRTSYRIGLAL